MSKKFDWIDLLIVILFVMAVYFVLTRLFGYSDSDLTISITLFTLMGGMLYKLNREFGEFKIRTITSFDNLKKDINGIKNTRRR